MTLEPHDEESISPEDVIIRRIHPVHHVVWDDDKKCNRISTKAYSPSSVENGGMSVDIEKLIVAAEHEPRNFVTTPVFTGSVFFHAKTIRALDLRIGFDPIPDNQFHGEVWGRARANRFSDTQRRGLRDAASWYVELEDVAIA